MAKRGPSLEFRSRCATVYGRGMPERSSKPSDLNSRAAAIVAEVTDESLEVKAHEAHQGKNPAAVALGRLGGRQGGRARAEKLSASERSEIARLAARARWSRRNDG
jgi:hypothetical protein